jgi:hypothetical protein
MAFVFLFAGPTRIRGAEPSREQIEFFEQKIRPVLVQHCYKCHSAQSAKIRGGLLLDSREGLLKGGDSRPALVPGDPDGSLLLKALRYEDHQMPPNGQLSEKVIADFQHWIRQGSPDPRRGTAAAPSSKAIDIPSGKQFWAFQPPRVHAPPAVCNTLWARKKM